MANSFFDTLGRVFRHKTREERIRDALDSAMMEILDICADDQSERITAAVGVLAATLRSNVPPDGHEHALRMATNQIANMLGVMPPATEVA